MPFRKSKRIGPMRLNLSGSGLGLSFGVKGFKVGVDVYVLRTFETKH